jgi:hypothetical protein
MQDKSKTMAGSMAATMAPSEAHKDIPGNPSTAKSSVQKLNDRSNGAPLKVLSEEDWAFWIQNGYVVIHDAVPKENTRRLAAFLWEFEQKVPSDPQTWYAPPLREIQMKELTNSGMVEVYNHQYLWDNRQYPRVHEAFTDIWGTEKLWVTIDRANLNLPMRPGFEFKGFIHWDYDPETKPQNVQGVLALADQDDESMGGFQCVPDLYRHYDVWKQTQPVDRDHFKPDTTGMDIVKVKMKEGDLLIFNSLLAHGIRPNRSAGKVRLAQYISMMPAQPNDEVLRQWRISSWKERKAPEGYAFPGDPREWEKTKYGTAELTELGKKLLGLEKW